MRRSKRPKYPELRDTGLTPRQWLQLKAIGGDVYSGDEAIAYRNDAFKSLRALEAKGFVEKHPYWRRAWLITQAGRIKRHEIMERIPKPVPHRLPERHALVG